MDFWKITIPSSYEGWVNINHCPNHYSCSFYVFKNLEKAPPPKLAACSIPTAQMEPPQAPEPPRPTLFFFMAEHPTDVSWGTVVPAILISWLVGWLTLYLENDVMWIRTLMLLQRNSMLFLGQDPCLYGTTLAMALVLIPNQGGQLQILEDRLQHNSVPKSRIHTVMPWLITAASQWSQQEDNHCLQMAQMVIKTILNSRPDLWPAFTACTCG